MSLTLREKKLIAALALQAMELLDKSVGVGGGTSKQELRNLFIKMKESAEQDI